MSKEEQEKYEQEKAELENQLKDKEAEVQKQLVEEDNQRALEEDKLKEAASLGAPLAGEAEADQLSPGERADAAATAAGDATVESGAEAGANPAGNCAEAAKDEL